MIWSVPLSRSASFSKSSVTKFNDELGGVTIEIDDESIDRYLPPEFCAMKTGAAQSPPKRLFRARRPFS